MPVYHLRPEGQDLFGKAVEVSDITIQDRENLRECRLESVEVDPVRRAMTFILKALRDVSPETEIHLKQSLMKFLPDCEEIDLKFITRIGRANHVDDTPVSAADPAVMEHGKERKFSSRDHLQAKPGQRKKRKNSVAIADLSDMEGQSAVFSGEICGMETVETKSGKTFIKYDVFDLTDTICVKTFKKESEEFKTGNWIEVHGRVEFDRFEQEIVVQAVRIGKADPVKREDYAPVKRIELHLHSKMSAMDGLGDIEEIVQTAKEFGHQALALTDHGVVQGFPEFYRLAKEMGLHPILGMEGYLVDDVIAPYDKTKVRPYHITILVRNREGLKNLYRLVSISHLEDFYKKPRIRRSHLMKYREGLLLGSACGAGEIIQQYLRDRNRKEEFVRIAGLYDFFEIMPRSNNSFLVRKELLSAEDGLEEMNRFIYELARETGRLCVATGDVHFVHPHDAINREIIQYTQGYEESDSQADLFFRTTDEMLDEFSYLGKDAAYEVVVTNPALIAGRVEDVPPIPKGFFPPKIENAETDLRRIVYQKATSVYGDPLPEIVSARLEREMSPITKHGFADLYFIAHKIVNFSLNKGYLVGSRGSVGSSLVATMASITEVNPLPPHYLCPNCRMSEFISEGAYECGADLPAKSCPSCGTAMKKDGFNIPFEVFLGFEGEKVPDIDLNFSGEIQTEVHRYAESIFGSAHSFKAGTIATFQDKAVRACVEKYLKENNLVKRKSEIRRLISESVGVKRTTGQHPGGIIVIPEGMDICDICPVQHPADDRSKEVVTTHFDYHVMDKQLVKLDLLGHDNPTIIKLLEETTGIKACDIPLDDPETIRMFQEVKTLGVPEFGTHFVRQVLTEARVRNFGDIDKICGLTHGTDVWNNNARDLVQKGVNFSEVITM
ncbi:MAG: PHP domain-containing protein, partial [Candidatus Wallbacteria bacterium]|nr:PHP domain-containing protein [Candidatus Wallbacteria bacterium]